MVEAAQNNARPVISSAPPIQSAAPIQIWGGVEYTYNRVNDTWIDQMDLSGHANRLTDYQAIADLGIRTLRTGVLWEHYERDGSSWARMDRHLLRQRQLGIRPIASLVHHGSGPSSTNLLDPDFASKLATYAGQVAERYPWIDAYTPVNEPLTTARFSALYGHWYPHHCSPTSFLRALLNQVRGVVLSMRAIRRVRPDAALIQTEDGGNITGTPELQSTCDMLNLRQLLTFDLLCGYVDRLHPLFSYLCEAGIGEHEILWFAENPCPPDVIGLNYYVTSDRYMDHRLELYPANRLSAEGPFADLEAVRARPEGIIGIAPLLERVWRRYRLPLAITEVHLGCSVESQIRWLVESWQGMQEAQRRGVTCTAMTIWALLGSYFWNELVTRPNGHYEPGVFSLANGRLEPTGLARVVAQLARGESPRHQALLQRGWWHQPDRLYHSVAALEAA